MNDIVDLNLKKELIIKQPFFSQLTNEEREVLATLLIEKHKTAGDTIVREGDPIDSVYIIVKGEAEVRHVTLKNHELQVKSVATLNPGESIGLNETGFYSISGVRTATVVAKSDMILLSLSLAALHGFALSYPHVNEIMRKSLISSKD